MTDEEKISEAPENGAATTAPAVAGPPSTEVLERELEAARAKAAEHLDGWLRAQAELQNFRKRVERDRAEMQQELTGKIIARYLEVLDDLDRALKHQPSEADGAAALAKWAQGIGAIHRKFQNILEAEGVSRIEADGQTFDPNLHEAVVHEESEAHTSGQIVEVLRHGYKIGDRVIRPALVKVAK
ncbi:MAG: nucleotide exchange factor GrpE [Anaerolineales bacterium]|nr:nucleotide exchange factor GrpE [Anaerolineales bacterium]